MLSAFALRGAVAENGVVNPAAYNPDRRGGADGVEVLLFIQTYDGQMLANIAQE
jgi:hypothetical protein